MDDTPQRPHWAVMAAAILLGIVLAVQVNLQRRTAASRPSPEQFAAERQKQASLQNKLDRVRRFAGLTPIKGPGIVITLRDAQADLPVEIDQSGMTVHDQDLLLLINELWAAGAQAISLNGQRIVGGTAVRCSGPVIEVNRVRVAPPFEIRATGTAATLATGLGDLPGGIVAQLREAGIDVKIEKFAELQVPALEREPTAEGVP